MGTLIRRVLEQTAQNNIYISPGMGKRMLIKEIFYSLDTDATVASRIVSLIVFRKCDEGTFKSTFMASLQAVTANQIAVFSQSNRMLQGDLSIGSTMEHVVGNIVSPPIILEDDEYIEISVFAAAAGDQHLCYFDVETGDK